MILPDFSTAELDHGCRRYIFQRFASFLASHARHATGSLPDALVLDALRRRTRLREHARLPAVDRVRGGRAACAAGDRRRGPGDALVRLPHLRPPRSALSPRPGVARAARAP